MAMLGGECSKCCSSGLKCYVPESTHGACCEVDGSCNIKPQCECDTENGAVFAGVGETCEACDKPCPDLGGPDSQIYNGTTLKATFSPFAFTPDGLWGVGTEECDHATLLSTLQIEISQPFAEIVSIGPSFFTALWSDGNLLPGSFQNSIEFLCGYYYRLSFAIYPPLPQCIKGMMVQDADGGGNLVWAEPESIRWNFYYSSDSSVDFLSMVEGTPISAELDGYWGLVGFYIDPLTGRRTAHTLGSASSSMTIENLNPLP